MDFRFREEEQAVAELARKILEDHATNERLKELEASGTSCDAALWQALAQANLLGTAIPEAHGGSELGFLALCLLLGMDAFLGLPEWRDYDRLLDYVNIIVARRPGTNLPDAGRLGRLLAARRVEPSPERDWEKAGQIIGELDLEINALYRTAHGDRLPR